MPENTNKVIQLQDTEGNDVSPVVNVGSIYDKNGQKIDNLLSYVVAGTDVPIPDVGNITDDLQDQVDQMVSTATSQVNEMVSTATSQIDAKLGAVDEALDGIDTAVDDKLSSGGLPINDVRTYPVREGEVIHAGDVVNVGAASDGTSDTIYKDVAPQDNVENVMWRKSINSSDTCALNSMCSIFAYSASDTGGYVMPIDNITGKQAAADATIFVSQAGVSSVSLARLDDSHFVVCYEANEMIRFQVGTVSDRPVSFGTEYNPGWGDTDSNPHYANIITIGTNTLFCCYNWGTEPEYALLTVSGTSISATVSRQSLANIASRISYISACRLPDEGSNKRVCICFSDTGDGNKGKAVIATINSSNAVTFGDVVTVRDESIVNTNCAYVDGIIYFYTGSCLYALSENLSVLGNQTIIGVSSQSTNGLIGLNNRVVVLNGVSGNGGATSARWDGGAIEYGEPYKFNGSNTANYISCAAISDNEILLAYADKGNSNYGTTTILEVNGNQIAGSFIDSSQDAIALADGTGGQSIPVGFGGYCECPEVTEGQQITSDGVSAFSPLDGWLSVTDARNTQVPATGSFTATTSLQTINLGFNPSMVICYTAINNADSVGNSESSSGNTAYIPRILTNAYKSSDGSIGNAGFTFRGAQTGTTVYYIALR